jgi:hypothetical protein
MSPHSHLKRIEKRIKNYLNQLDDADKDDQLASETTISRKIEDLKITLSALETLAEKVEAAPDKQISTTDPDSRLMKVKGMIRQVCYNVQTAVDTKHHLIVAHEVTNTTDRGQLCMMGKQAQTVLGKEDITVIADKGYFSSLDIKDTQDAGMIALVPKSDTSGSEKKGIFNRDLFKYNSEKDLYICPENKELQYRFSSLERGLTLKIYFLDIMTCRQCSRKSECTKGDGQRRIRRWEHEDRIDTMTQMLKTKPDSMLIRKQTVEHPFGTIKFWMGSVHFLTKRFKNVSIEMNLHVLAYNFKRMLSIYGPEQLMKKLMA